jgi:beta-glucanase (GH16 family)
MLRLDTHVEGLSMSLRSLALQRCAVSLAAVFLVSACTEDGRETPLSGVEAIDIPVADIDNQANQNIDNPTLQTPATFQVNDGDLLTLVWSDEFDGAQLDPEVWFYETGDGSQYGFGENGALPGWGNNELEYYLPDNVQLVNGALQITARRESADGYNFTSGRINTQDRFAFKYGRIEASIKFPSGQGLWPAFWMLSQDSPYGEWAATGEIDIVEAVNLDGTGGNEIFATIHFGGAASAGQNTSTETRYTPSFDVTEDFHTYAFEWDEFEMRWYVDGTLYKVENFWSSTGGAYPAPFDQPFHVLFNLAVGGNFPGSPDGSTPFPATMEVDWVRVYSGEAPAVVPADPGIIPDDVIYATDQDEVVDLVTTVVAFGTSTTLDGSYALDADFKPAFLAQSGDGYGLDNIAQLGFIDLPAGFATGYESFIFKIKSDDLPNNTIIVKLEGGGGAYGNVVLTDTNVSTPLGNGWYQVVLPMSGFTNVAPAVGVLFEAVGAQNADGGAPFSFLLTDIGFNNLTGGGGVTSLGVFSETHTETVVNITNIVSAGNPVTIDTASAAVTPFDGAVSLGLIYSDNTANNFYGGAIFEFSDEDLSAYDTLKFSIDTSAFANFANLTVQLEPPAGGTAGGNVGLAGYTPVATTGNWNTYEIPLADFTAVNPSLVNRLGFFNARDGGDVLLAGTLYLDDIHFTTVGGGSDCVRPAPAAGVELATNGDFEAGDLSCWEAIANGGTISADNTENNGGTWSAHVVTAGASNPTLKQNFLAEGTVQIGDVIDISFDMKGTAGAGGIIFPKLISEGAGGSDGPILQTIDIPTADWTTYTYSPTITADVARGITFEISVVCGAVAGCTADVFIDNVSVTIR